MIRFNKRIIGAILSLAALPAVAQTTYPLTVEVSAVTDVSTQGLIVTLAGDETGGWVFDPMKVKADGTVKFSYVPEGTFTLTVDGTPLGLEKYVNDNIQHSEAQTVKVVLQEAVRNPYALKTDLIHDDFTGKNSLSLSWNRETDYFFDDFESYEPFAIEFSPWTGHDLDKEPAAEIQGYYPNRGIPQYATIFNALTIDPPVYYAYEVLRPYSGKQYVGFVRTRSGAANNDWLISPKIKVGVDNVVSFMAKASEYTPDRFAVCISTKGTEVSDFVQLTPGNYETVDYQNWKEVRYSLAAYEGKEVYIAIHCMSQNSFIFMVDDFYVGPAQLPKKALRVNRHSAANPNEKFVITLDGNKVGETENYDFSIDEIAAGKHTVGVKATYVNAESEETKAEVNVAGEDSYAKLTVTVKTEFGEAAEGADISLLNTATARQTKLTADADGAATVGYLEKGEYLLNVTSALFDEYNTTLTFDGDKDVAVTLNETVTNPYNVLYQTTADENGATVELWWNRNLGFRDSFETYPDFTQEIGDWTVIDGDQMPTYAFQIGESMVTKPESRGLVGAMVFNPYATEPVQASDDGLFIAPDGDKYVMFNSAEMALSNDWLISPDVKIGADYVLRFTAKSYTSLYPGSFEFYAIKDNDVTSGELLDRLQLEEEWVRYEVSLAQFEGESIQVGIHHNTYDGWLSFIDDVYVGPSEESTEEEGGNDNCTFDIYLDDEFNRNVETSYCKFEGLEEGTHKVGIQAVYNSGKKSGVTEVTFTIEGSGVEAVVDAKSEGEWRYFTPDGIEVDKENLSKGLYIRVRETEAERIFVF